MPAEIGVIRALARRDSQGTTDSSNGYTVMRNLHGNTMRDISIKTALAFCRTKTGIFTVSIPAGEVPPKIQPVF
jgi:hypothetical protein